MASSFVSNQGTQTNLLTDTTGGTSSSGTMIPVMKIDTSAAGTAGAIWNGSITGVGTLPGVGAITALGTLGTLGLGTVQMTSGTISVLPNIPGGTINLGTVAGKDANAVAQTANPFGVGGTDSGGTIRTIKVDSGGLQRIGIDSGTISVLPNLPQGSINVTAGTIATLGTLGTLGLGTVQMTSGTISVLPNLPQGSINVTAGTIATLGTMGTLGTLQNVGSITNLGQVYNAGTLQAGTINTGTFVMTAGTLSPIPSIAINTFGSHGTTGVSIFGTLAGGTGSGAGTEIFITSLSLTIPSTGGSQDVSIGWGSNGGTFQNGTGLLVRGNFPAGGGIQKQFYPPVNSGTNAQLMYFQAGAGTVDISVSYFTAVSSL